MIASNICLAFSLLIEDLLEYRWCSLFSTSGRQLQEKLASWAEEFLLNLPNVPWFRESFVMEIPLGRTYSKVR